MMKGSDHTDFEFTKNICNHSYDLQLFIVFYKLSICNCMKNIYEEELVAIAAKWVKEG